MLFQRSRFKSYGGNLRRGGNGMIGASTIKPARGVGSMGLERHQADPYFTLTVSTETLTEPTKVVLFDASAGYQRGFNYTNPAGVVVTGKTADYQFMLNTLPSEGIYFDIIKQVVSQASTGTSDAALAQRQFLNPIEIFRSSLGASPALINTMHPSMGIHEGQYQLTINTFAAPNAFTNLTALVYTQEPDVLMTWAFYQKAKIGAQL